MFNVVRFKRVKNTGVMTSIQQHNFRKHNNIKSVDYNLTERNIYLVGDKNVNLSEEFKKLKEKFGFRYEKNKSVMYDEFVISASSEFFKGKSKKEKEQYFRDNLDILQKHFFKVENSIVSAIVHFDEKTPHMHVVACPLIRDTEKVIKRGKDKGKTIKGDFVSLSHDRLFGKRQQCRELQTIFNEELKKKGYNLQRGLQNTGIKYTTKREYEKELLKLDEVENYKSESEKELKEIENMSLLEKIVNYKKIINRFFEFIDEVKQVFKQNQIIQMQNEKLTKQNERFKLKLDAQAKSKEKIKQEEKKKAEEEIRAEFIEKSKNYIRKEKEKEKEKLNNALLKKDEMIDEILAESKNFEQLTEEQQTIINNLNQKLETEKEEKEQIRTELENHKTALLEEVEQKKKLEEVLKSNDVLYSNFLTQKEFLEEQQKQKNKQKTTYTI